MLDEDRLEGVNIPKVPPPFVRWIHRFSRRVFPMFAGDLPVLPQNAVAVAETDGLVPGLDRGGEQKAAALLAVIEFP